MSKPGRTLDTDKLHRTLVQVAHLYYDDNLSQQQIADRLGVSRSLIAQYLQRARDAGIVRIHIMDPDGTCTELEQGIKEEAGLEHVTVTPNPHGSQELAFRAVADAASEYLGNVLRDGDTLGLAWGRMLRMVVDLLKPPKASGIDVLPIMGESGHSGMHSQMNHLVMHAAEKLGANPQFLSLPMVVSSPFLRDALLNEEGIRDVTARWNRLSVACVGIGVVPPVPGMVVYIGEQHLPRMIEAGAVGDICGIYYDSEGKVLDTGLEDRTIGIDQRQLRRVKRLVAVACGAEKMGAVVGALRMGLLSSLFIDQSLAERVLTGLRAEGVRKPRKRRQA